MRKVAGEGNCLKWDEGHPLSAGGGAPERRPIIHKNKIPVPYCDETASGSMKYAFYTTHH